MMARRNGGAALAAVLLQLAVLSVLAGCVAPKSWGADGRRKKKAKQARKAKQSKSKQAAGNERGTSSAKVP